MTKIGFVTLKKCISNSRAKFNLDTILRYRILLIYIYFNFDFVGEHSSIFKFFSPVRSKHDSILRHLKRSKLVLYQH